MFKLLDFGKAWPYYNEVSQPNALRWRVLHREGNTFRAQSGLIKCKDFFNDVVAARHGVEFEVYNFNNRIKINEEGIYLHLTNIENKSRFLHNLEVVNEQLWKDLNTKVEVLDDESDATKLIILIPDKVWETTYYISLLTWCIRLCNYATEYHNWQDLWVRNAPSATVDTPAAGYRSFVSERGFKLPIEGYWWYASKELNSKGRMDSQYTLHNNGVYFWCQAATMGY